MMYTRNVWQNLPVKLFKSIFFSFFRRFRTIASIFLSLISSVSFGELFFFLPFPPLFSVFFFSIFSLFLKLLASITLYLNSLLKMINVFFHIQNILLGFFLLILPRDIYILIFVSFVFTMKQLWAICIFSIVLWVPSIVLSQILKFSAFNFQPFSFSLVSAEEYKFSFFTLVTAINAERCMFIIV